MESIRFLEQKINGKWKIVGQGITNGNFVVKSPGTYRIIWRVNRVYQAPGEEVTVQSGEEIVI